MVPVWVRRDGGLPLLGPLPAVGRPSPPSIAQTVPACRRPHRARISLSAKGF